MARRLQQAPTGGMIHHSDRGSQYCAHDYRQLLDLTDIWERLPHQPAASMNCCRTTGSPLFDLDNLSYTRPSIWDGRALTMYRLSSSMEVF